MNFGGGLYMVRSWKARQTMAGGDTSLIENRVSPQEKAICLDMLNAKLL